MWRGNGCFLWGAGVKAGLDLGAGADMSVGPCLAASREVVEP